MILDLSSHQSCKSKVTTEVTHGQIQDQPMILDVSLLLGIKSKITTEDPGPEETGWARPANPPVDWFQAD
jgi:hypothetical protein